MRFELTVRNIDQIPKITEILKAHNLTKLNLTDKTGMPYNLDAAELLLEENPDFDIIPHYAFKNHTNRFPEQIIANFKEFLVQSEAQQIKQILLLSGNPKPKFEVLKSLELIDNLEQKPDLEFSCGYNPYFEGSHLEAENERLKTKLSSGLLESVYLQIGVNLTKLEAGIEYLRSLNPKVKIYGCLLLPNDRLLKNFIFRPWFGVFLDEEYLSSLEIAHAKTREVLDIYSKHDVEPLVELPSLTDESLDMLDQFLG